MDQRVLEVQQWLNYHYLQYSSYKTVVGENGIDEDGVTGGNTFKALICALQIELGITEPTGTFGPTTQADFTTQYGSLTYDPEMTPTHFTAKNSIFILQGSFWCKGYNPGGFTGYFGDGTANAVQTFKKDVGLSDTTPEVDALLMKAIMNTDGYVLSSSGDEKIREMQQYLNENYVDYIGEYMPTDGVYQRATNTALIYALQKEEGMSSSIANGNFGNQTAEMCPILSMTQGTVGQIRVLQYALYCNGYSVDSFNGVYDTAIQNQVKRFQAFMVLSVTGIADMPTIKALLTSNGYTERSCKACDCSTPINEARADTLIDAGIQVVGRYISGTSKKITNEEIQIIFAKGLRFFPIYQTTGDSSEYFNEQQGITDAMSAILSAEELKIPKGTVIYFAVDFDAYDYEVQSNIKEYFKGINTQMAASGSPYRIGAYGSRNICTTMYEAGYAVYSFVGDMSTGYSGNLGYSMPKNWAFDQFVTTTYGTGPGEIEIDKDGYSGRDYGVSYLAGDTSKSENTEVIQQIQSLYDMAETYSAGAGNALVCQFIRRNEYDSQFWDIVAGEIDEKFISYGEMALNYADVKDPSSMEESSNIQITHLMASLNALLFTSDISDVTGIESIDGLAQLYDLLHSGSLNNSYIDELFNNFAGWAGDLVTVCGDVENAVKDKPTPTQADYNSAAAVYVGSRTNIGSFGYIDLLCDIDAVNLYALIKSGKNLAEAFEEYYGGATVKRFTKFVENGFSGSTETLRNKCNEFLTGNTLALIAARTWLLSYRKSIEFTSECASAVVSQFVSLVLERINQES